MNPATQPKARERYPFVAFRPTPLLERRLKALSKKSGQSVSALVKECVAAHLALLETAHKEAQ